MRKTAGAGAVRVGPAEVPPAPTGAAMSPQTRGSVAAQPVIGSARFGRPQR
ncbi:hypothetical protein [Streptomyces sp. NPDC001070]